MNLLEAQSKVDNWIRTFGVRYFSELTNMAILTEEVGEVARLIARKYGDQSFRKGVPEGELADEMADVLFVLICLANQTGVDLTSAFERNLAKKTQRDSQRHKSNPKLAGKSNETQNPSPELVQAPETAPTEKGPGQSGSVTAGKPSNRGKTPAVRSPHFGEGA